MRLTDGERALLDGASGRAARVAMEILVALGEIYGAEEMVPVRSVQVSGVSFHNLGEAGLEWLREMARDGRARVLATLNPAGMDLERWRDLGVDPEFARRQQSVIEAYTAMGIAPWCTCTPYLVGNLPGPGEHVAWAESSAVAYANSVLGARTNREGGPSALAAALTGRTPRYGLHLDENRRPEVVVTLDAAPRDTAEWGALGALLGRRHGARVLRLRAGATHPFPPPTPAELKALGAALVTYGGSPLFHVDSLTPSAPPGPAPAESDAVDRAALDDALAALDDGSGGGDRLDMVTLGCPHASLEELTRVAALLDGRRVRVPLWVSTARATAEAAARLGLVERIEASGAVVVRDTCFAVAPLDRPGATVATDSAKGCYYGRGHNGLRMRIGSPERCVEAAVRGRWA